MQHPGKTVSCLPGRIERICSQPSVGRTCDLGPSPASPDPQVARLSQSSTWPPCFARSRASPAPQGIADSLGELSSVCPYVLHGCKVETFKLEAREKRGGHLLLCIFPFKDLRSNRLSNRLALYPLNLLFDLWQCIQRPQQARDARCIFEVLSHPPAQSKGGSDWRRKQSVCCLSRSSGDSIQALPAQLLPVESSRVNGTLLLSIQSLHIGCFEVADKVVGSAALLQKCLLVVLSFDALPGVAQTRDR